MSVNNNQLSDIDNIGEMKINGSYFKQINHQINRSAVISGDTWRSLNATRVLLPLWYYRARPTRSVFIMLISHHLWHIL